MRYLGDLDNVVGGAYTSFINTQTSSLWNADRDSLDDFGERWSRPESRRGPERQRLAHPGQRARGTAGRAVTAEEGRAPCRRPRKESPAAYRAASDQLKIRCGGSDNSASTRSPVKIRSASRTAASP